MDKRLRDILTGKEDNYLLPFYWQHGDHTDTIPEEVERIYQSGARALCVESRPHRDFAGEGWWRDMDIILAEAEKRNMKVWVLDDDHFPTGHAVGQVKNHPELRKWQLVERHIDIMGPVRDASVLTDKTNDDHVLLGIYAYPRTGEGEAVSPDAVDLTDCAEGGWLHWDVPAGCWRVFFLYKSRRGTYKSDYIDMINPESVRLLIDAVYEAHYAHYKRYFGTVLAGFFSDEPLFGNDWFGAHDTDRGMYNRRVSMPGLALPWNDKVIEMMENDGISDPVRYFPALWFEMDEVTPAVRHAYMNAVTQLYRDCFTRQLGDWCRAHGVQYIGHIIEDMNAHARLGCSAGHYFRALDGQDMSGIDIVLHQVMPGSADYIHTMSAFGNNADPTFFDYVLGKLAASAAHINPQMGGRAMCEVFGAYGWAEGTPMMKWLMDFLLVRGINRFVPHAFSPAFPDPDCPPHFGANGNDPQFEGFTALMNYVNKAAHLLSDAVHCADAAILYHADSEWMSRHGDAMLTQVPAKILYDNHIDYDIVPADAFLPSRCHNSSVYVAYGENGKLHIGEETYQCLIVPAGEVPEELEAALTVLARTGVPVIRMEKGVDLLAEVNKVIEPDVTVDCECPLMRIYHCRRDGADIYMLANESVSDTVDCDVTLSLDDSVKEGVMLDLLNDDCGVIPAANGTIHVKLVPYQSVIVVMGNADDTLPAKKEWRKICDADISLRVETAPYSDMDHYSVYAESVGAKELFNINGRDHMPDFSGKIRYTGVLTLDEASLEAERIGIDLGEAGQTAKVWCNGREAGIRICPPYRFDLTGLVHAGENELVIETANTLANAVKDHFSYYIALPAAGVLGPIEIVGGNFSAQ